MDRLLKIYAKKGYILAEILFKYGLRNQVTAKITEYRMFEYEDSETGEITYSTSSSGSRDQPYVTFRQLKNMEEIKRHDIDFAKNQLWDTKIGDPNDYTFTYGEGIQQARYFIGRNHTNYILGVADVQYNFEENTKQVKFLSGQGLKWDFEMSGDCFETNLDLIAKIPLYDQWGNPWEPAVYDIMVVDTW